MKTQKIAVANIRRLTDGQTDRKFGRRSDG